MIYSFHENEIIITDSNETVINSINFSVSENLSNLKITIIKLENRPVEVGDLPAQAAPYSFLQIYITADDINIDLFSLSLINIKFKVKNEWLRNNSLDKNNINLVSYKNGRWVSEITSETTQDNIYTYYQSSSSTFSNLAIIGIKTAAQEKSSAFVFNSTFIIIIVILTIVLVVFILFKTGILYIEEEISEELDPDKKN